jgi:cation diffusion facilitator CzcD-associated flavoprotein CzcO
VLRTPGGFEHDLIAVVSSRCPERNGWRCGSDSTASPGSASGWQNFREIFMDEDANAEFSEFIADKIRQRVKDPVTAEKLIPKDHGFGVQRVPLETHYFEVYNRDNVELVDIAEAPIERVTAKGIRTSEKEYEFDIIVYATGFDAITGAYDRIDIRGVGGEKLRDKWADGPVTYLGMLISGFPNMIMLAGPQSGSASTNYPRGIETRRRLDH